MSSRQHTLVLIAAGTALALLSACGGAGKTAAKTVTASEPPAAPPSAATAPTSCRALPAEGRKPELPCLPGSSIPKTLIVKDVTVGSGPAAKVGDTLTVDYRGALYPGGEFDNSYDRGQPFPVPLGQAQVIQGWDEGLVGMKAGGKRLLVIPPDKGYGVQGQGPIPPNATLRFIIELHKIS